MHNVKLSVMADMQQRGSMGSIIGQNQSKQGLISKPELSSLFLTLFAGIMKKECEFQFNSVQACLLKTYSPWKGLVASPAVSGTMGNLEPVGFVVFFFYRKVLT